MVSNTALLIPLAAICFPIMGLVAVLGFVLVLRYLRMKETAMLLERGYSPDQIAAQRRDGHKPHSALFAGIITAMVGLAISVGLYPIGLMSGSPFPFGLGPWMIAGFLPLFVGIGLVLWHYLTVTDSRGGRA